MLPTANIKIQQGLGTSLSWS